MKKFLFSIVLILCAKVAYAQKLTSDQKAEKIISFDRKLLFGLTFSLYHSTIQGNKLPDDYFDKQSIGIQFNVEYYFRPFLGIGLGAGYQQRGTGIKTHSAPVSGATPDSTYRRRLRFNTIELPISIFIRTPNDVIKGLRFSGSASLIPLVNLNSRDVFLVLEPTIADISKSKNVSSDYFKQDLLIQFSAGPEIDSGGSGIFKIHFTYGQGTSNVFAQNQGIGNNHSTGIRITWLFGIHQSAK